MMLRRGVLVWIVCCGLVLFLKRLDICFLMEMMCCCTDDCEMVVVQMHELIVLRWL